MEFILKIYQFVWNTNKWVQKVYEWKIRTIHYRPDGRERRLFPLTWRYEKNKSTIAAIHQQLLIKIFFQKFVVDQLCILDLLQTAGTVALNQYLDFDKVLLGTRLISVHLSWSLKMGLELSLEKYIQRKMLTSSESSERHLRHLSFIVIHRYI